MVFFIPICSQTCQSPRPPLARGTPQEKSALWLGLPALVKANRSTTSQGPKPEEALRDASGGRPIPGDSSTALPTHLSHPESREEQRRAEALHHPPGGRDGGRCSVVKTGWNHTAGESIWADRKTCSEGSWWGDCGSRASQRASLSRNSEWKVWCRVSKEDTCVDKEWGSIRWERRARLIWVLTGCSQHRTNIPEPWAWGVATERIWDNPPCGSRLIQPPSHH